MRVLFLKDGEYKGKIIKAGRVVRMSSDTARNYNSEYHIQFTPKEWETANIRQHISEFNKRHTDEEE